MSPLCASPLKGGGEPIYLVPPPLARYYVDGSTYIDEHAVVRQLTGLAAGEYYYLLKELYSVAGLANANGALIEAYTYDAYGKVRVYTAQAAPCDQPGDVDGDGDVDMADFEALSLCYGPSGVPGDCPPGALERLDFNTNGVVDDADLEAFAAVVTGPQFGLFADGDWNSNGAVGPIDHNAFVNVCYSGPGGGFNTNGCQVFDFDGDGDVDLDDYGVLLALWYESSPNAPMTLTAADASPVNDYYFTGRSLDFVPHGGERHQRYYYRARTYNTERFMQRDPKNYIDTMNCYAYARAMPTTWYDPFGLQVLEPGVVGEPTPGFPDSNASSPTSSTTEPKPKVEVCCRKTNISCCVDMALTVVKAEHCFISTATKAAGMGPAQCGSADEESSPCCGTPTAITDHAGESSKPKVKCTALKNCDMECVNQELEIGKPTGNWSLKNNCNTLVRQVLLVCNCRNKCHRRYTERVVNRKTGDVFYIRRCISWDYDPRLPIPGHPDDADDYVTWGSS